MHNNLEIFLGTRRLGEFFKTALVRPYFTFQEPKQSPLARLNVGQVLSYSEIDHGKTGIHYLSVIVHEIQQPEGKHTFITFRVLIRWANTFTYTNRK